jgi:hypothetical protein
MQALAPLGGLDSGHQHSERDAREDQARENQSGENHS